MKSIWTVVTIVLIVLVVIVGIIVSTRFGNYLVKESALLGENEAVTKARDTEWLLTDLSNFYEECKAKTKNNCICVYDKFFLADGLQLGFKNSGGHLALDLLVNKKPMKEEIIPEQSACWKASKEFDDEWVVDGDIIINPSIRVKDAPTKWEKIKETLEISFTGNNFALYKSKRGNQLYLCLYNPDWLKKHTVATPEELQESIDKGTKIPEYENLC